jgi:ribosome-binding factor A
MSRVRVEKVQELMKQELSQIILREMKDPRIGFVTVTQVRMSGDLSRAEIFLSLLGSEDEKQQTLSALSHSLGFLRSEVGKRIKLRYTPELVLKLDDSLEYSANIQRLLLQIEKEPKS